VLYRYCDDDYLTWHSVVKVPLNIVKWYLNYKMPSIIVIIAISI
jgi:hypothetical protein